MAPLFRAAGWRFEILDRDTDALGTFSGDVERRGSPLEVAVAKARLAAGESRSPWWMASEGSLSSGPWGLAHDHELVVLVHGATGVVVAGEARSHDVVLVGVEVLETTSDEQMLGQLAGADLGRHHLMVVSLTHDVPARGALRTLEEVVEARRAMSAPGRRLRIQTDCRAHLSPSRGRVIEAATRDLLSRMNSSCPRCAGPGWALSSVVEGRRCAVCARPTSDPRAEVWTCPWCGERREVLLEESGVDPARCPWCNP